MTLRTNFIIIFLRSDRFVGLALIALAISGLIHLEISDWRPAPGGGNDLMPRIAYWAMMIASIPITVWPGPLLKREERPLWPMILTLAGAAIYFYGVRYIGIATSSAIFIAAVSAMISDWRLHRGFPILILALASGLCLWGLFTYVAPIVIRPSIIF